MLFLLAPLLFLARLAYAASIVAAPETALPPLPAAAAAQPLSALDTAGYAVLPAGSVFAPRLEAEILDYGLAREAPITLRHRLPESAAVWKDHAEPRADDPAEARIGKAMADMAESLTRRLLEALPEERFRYDYTELRVTDGQPVEQDVHPDGTFLTASLALAGPGTILHVDPTPRTAPTGALAVITGAYRQEAVDVPATLHAAPAWSARRVLLLFRYLGREDAEAHAAHFKLRQRRGQ